MRKSLRGATYVFGLLLLLAVSWAAWRAWVRWEQLQPLPPEFERRQSAIWMGHKWFGKAPASDEILAEGQGLNALGFRDLYFHVGPLNAKGEIPAWDRANWSKTLAQFRQTIPQIRAFAWVGGVTVQSYGVANDTIDDSRSEVRAGIVTTCQLLSKEGGFDGIHYDLEVINPGDEDFIKLLDETRSAIKPLPVSIAAPYFWNRRYLEKVALHCDQIALMSYDLKQPNAAAYQNFLKLLIPLLCDEMTDGSCKLVLGVPTYEEPTPSHDPAVENIETALIGIKAGLLKTRSHRAFQGVGLYADWTMDEEKWKTFLRYWTP